jgi:hypothetical protein
LGDTFRIEGFTLASDVATFRFEKGTLTFLKPVLGAVTGAIFVGEGHFNLKPLTPLDVRELHRRIGAEEVDEEFTAILFRFTAEGHLKFLPALKDQVESPEEAASTLKHWREKLRERREHAASITEYLLDGEDMDNVDADVLAAIYNPSHPPFFNAYIHGKKHKDLRYFFRSRVGALP